MNYNFNNKQDQKVIEEKQVNLENFKLFFKASLNLKLIKLLTLKGLGGYKGHMGYRGDQGNRGRL